MATLYITLSAAKGPAFCGAERRHYAKKSIVKELQLIRLLLNRRYEKVAIGLRNPTNKSSFLRMMPSP